MAGLRIGRTANGGELECEIEAVAGDAFQYLDGFGNDFRSDSVPGQYGDFHG
ncbi:hypothetical protein GALL_392020 [mine drainage metagenome]|uniref:Uncharacterized protein n=1 Tax=mine drainage metagenome TaxID=410659 RepID=A0A1J5Q7B7_9ZZZZ